MKALTRLIFSMCMALGLILVIAPAINVVAASNCTADYNIDNGIKCAAPEGSNTSRKLEGKDGIFVGIINTLIFVIGALAVLMIVIGGLRYVLSGGDAKGVENAKNAILYAIIGLVVAIGAYAIVQAVLAKFK